MKTVAFIFARGGSKGIPNKNLHLFGGKPLIVWSIEQALAIKEIDRLIVSTDSEEIKKIALEYGAEVPFIRPKELSQDNSPEWLAWQHALKYLIEDLNYNPDIMVSVPTTSPLRSTKDIMRCIDLYKKGDSDIIVTISETDRSPYFNMVHIDDDKTLRLVSSPLKTIYNRQNAPEVFNIATVCYVSSPDFILNNNSLFDGKVRAIQVPFERSIDIDNMFDLKFAESILKQLNDE
tara:strand:+ start:381 stop:1082 length:702 start_codon:yes stop_codon:yes gene_type:complete